MCLAYLFYIKVPGQKKNFFVVENLLTVDTREEDGVTFEMNINGDVFLEHGWAVCFKIWSQVGP